MVTGSSLKVRGKGICPRPKARIQHVMDKWVIAWSERERKA
jgi:hypothetical protein